LSGEVYWERRNVARGCEITGDGRTVFLQPPDSDQVIALRAADGADVGIHTLPDAESRLMTTGGTIVAWTQTGDGRMLRGIDARTADVRWQHAFSDDAQADVVEAEEIAVLEPQGRLVIVSAGDGKPRFEQRLEPADGLQGLTVLRARERYVVLTRVPHRQPNLVNQASFGVESRLVNGPAYALDRETGEILWSTRVENQGIDLNQPPNLPVLIFTIRHYPQFPAGRVAQQYSLLVLDARTGREIHDENSTQSMQNFDVLTDRGGESIQLDFYSFSVRLTTTDDPLPEPASLKSEP
ncbi:MAG: PQQ-binding-like beta-propeller repeat protein, partial [Planctomycetaceae bacterium]